MVIIMLLFILSDGDDLKLAQCCTSVVDGGPTLNLHWVIVPWSLCFVCIQVLVCSCIQLAGVELNVDMAYQSTGLASKENCHS